MDLVKLLAFTLTAVGLAGFAAKPQHLVKAARSGDQAAVEALVKKGVGP